MTEKDLVEMILAGKIDAFEPLVAPYRRPLLGLASRMTRNEEDAREAAQETLFRAFRYLRKYDTGRSFRTWLFGILVNEARRLRAARAMDPRDSFDNPGFRTREPASNETAPDERHSRNETRSRLMECLKALSPLEKEVFLLRDIEDLPVKETAKVLGTSFVSVRVHLSRARRKIREAVLEKFPDLAKEKT